MNEVRAVTSSGRTNPPDTSGWKIEMFTRPGPLGRATSTAEASKAGRTISAMASAPSVAMAMVKDMIHRRDG
jgi:hypothetical protein